MGILYFQRMLELAGSNWFRKIDSPLVSVPANHATEGVPIRMQCEWVFPFSLFVNHSNLCRWIHGRSKKVAVTIRRQDARINDGRAGANGAGRNSM